MIGTALEDSANPLVQSISVALPMLEMFSAEQIFDTDAELDQVLTMASVFAISMRSDAAADEDLYKKIAGAAPAQLEEPAGA